MTQGRICNTIFCLLFLLFAITACGQRREQETLTAAVLPEVTAPPSEDDAGPPPAPDLDPEPEPDPKQIAVEAVLSGMDLEEKVGQMFFVRCPEIGAEEKISEYHLGGYLLFSRDFQGKDAQQVIDMTAAYQTEAAVPLLIGADEEGGTVVRLSRNKQLFPEKFKSPQALCASGGLEAIRDDVLDKSTGLLHYGVNINFAPVADVSTNPSDFIYDRSFGQDAAATSEYIQTVVSAANECVYKREADGKVLKIGSVLKHFPGYGNNLDTHTGIAVDDRPYEQFEQSDFLPFRSGIEAGAGAVLVSHNVVNCMDPNFPASLSAEVHRVLREELDFSGVILTDDLAMDAVETYAEDGSAAVLAVLAGNDMIVTTDFEVQIPLVIDAVRTGLIDENILDSAVRRVLSWKYDLGLLQ